MRKVISSFLFIVVTFSAYAASRNRSQVHIGVILPANSHLIEAIRLAIDDIQNRTDILPDYELVLDVHPMYTGVRTLFFRPSI